LKRSGYLYSWGAKALRFFAARNFKAPVKGLFAGGSDRFHEVHFS